METNCVRADKRPSDAEEAVDTSDFIVVKRSKKKGKYGDNGANVSESQGSQPTTASTSAHKKEYRLTFPRGMKPRDRSIWIQEVANKHRNLSVLPKPTATSIVAVTSDPDTKKFLMDVGHPYNNNIIRLTEITEENKHTKVIIKNYPSWLPLQYIKDHPPIIWAERNTHRHSETPRNQVIAMWEGEPPTYLRLPGVRPCRVERFVGKPAFCGDCQRWGHKAWQCDDKVRCGFCSGGHNTKLCKDRISKGEKIVPRCPNCYQEHNAWSPRCPKRPDSGRLNNDPGRKAAVPQSPPPAITALSFPPLTAPSGERSSFVQVETSTHLKTQPDPTEISPSAPPTAAPGPVSPPLLPHPSPPGATSSEHHSHTAPQATPTTTLETEMTALKEEVRQLKLTQVTLQKENKDLRSIVTSMQTVVQEVLSMKALLVQALAGGVTGGQNHSEQCNSTPKVNADAHETAECETPMEEQRDYRESNVPSDHTGQYLTAGQPRATTEPTNGTGFPGQRHKASEATPSWN